MPRSDADLESIRLASRERILMAALAVFARRGYAGATVRDIAAEAGVSLGLMYNYFRGKEDVLRAIFEGTLAQVGESLGRAGRGATPQEGVAELVRGAFEILRANLDFWRLSYQIRMQPDVLERLGNDVRVSSESIRAEIERLLRAAGAASPAVQARVVFAAIDGVAQHYALDPENYPLDDAANALLDMLAPVLAATSRAEEET